MEDTAKKIENLAVELTGIKSIVGTAGEADIAHKIYQHLSQLPYFKDHPDKLRLLDINQDKAGRKNVLAYIEGSPGAARTVLCLGHIDTVGIQDYAELQPYATCPDKLRQELAKIQFCDKTRQEIESGEWIFGRGIFDMKTGIAALMVMLEGFSARAEEMNANLVFLAVADEEGQSLGMLSGVEYLDDLAKAKGWEFIATVDTDYMTGSYPDDQHKYIYIGSVGKLLPSFYIYGEETHVGEAFNGLDANLLASEVLYQMDMNTELCDLADGEVTLPPVSLQQRDLKTEYSVQTVNSVTLYFNYATHCSKPGEVLAKCKEKAVTAFENVIRRLNEQYEKYCSLAAIPFKQLPWEVEVLTYEELYQQVKQEIGEKIDDVIEGLARELKEQGIDDREFSLKIVQEVHKHYSNQNAKIIVYFAPPYYPHIYIKGEEEKERQLLRAVNTAVADAKKDYDYDIVIKKFYPYISDLSYCSISKQPDDILGLTDNMPAWGRQYTLPIHSIQNISMPVVNIGPYGKDAHKLSERVCRQYSFDAMPLILEKTLKYLL